MSIITPAAYREHDPSCSLGDDALQRIIDGNEAEMVRRIGPIGIHEEQFRGGQTTVQLRQRAATINEVNVRLAGDTTFYLLDAADYRLWDDGLTLQRLMTGSNARMTWETETRVEYIGKDDLAERVLAMLDLTGIDVTVGVASGTLQSRTMGSWSETYASGSPGSVKTPSKEAVYARLSPTGGIVFA